MKEKYSGRKYLSEKEGENVYPYIKLTTIVVVIITILAAMWFWGIAILSNIDAFWKIFNPESDAILSSSKEKSPPPPYLLPLTGATKDPKVTVKGYALEGIMVKLYVNDKERDSVRTDKEGSFTFFNVDLTEGANTLLAKADAGNGIESPPSQTITVKLLNKPPQLEVTEPADRADLRQKESITSIRGRTDAAATVSINGQKALVTSDGTFTYLFPLNEGENKIVIESSDEAGNKTTVEKTITFARVF